MVVVRQIKNSIKPLFISKGRALRRLKGGLAKGLYMELDLSTQLQRYWGLDERELIHSFQRLIPKCKSLIDIGANDGYYTLAFLRSPAARVIACEPAAHEAGQLLCNAQANGYDIDERFTIENQLIGSGEGYISVSELIKDLPKPILLKVDIDGGEFNLLSSAESCPSLADLFWIIETHSKELERQCVEWLRSHDYSVRLIYNAPWRVFIPEQRPIPHNRWLVAEPNR